MKEKPQASGQDFTALVTAVCLVHDHCAAAVNRTVNTTLTLRNWLIGNYIRDYEQHGADRAQDERTRIISAREAIRKERIFYEESQQSDR